MRLLKLGIYYHSYLKDFYERQSELRDQSYAVQHDALIEDFFGSSNFWTSELNKLNYETIDIIANAEFLQKKWANENNAKFDEKNWIFEIVTAQIKSFRPNILLVADYSIFTADFLRNIRHDCPSIRLILGWCGAPYSDSSVFAEWDIVLSCVPELVAEFKKSGHRSFHVNHAFAPRVLDKLNVISTPSVDFTFTGSIIKQNQFHIEREKLLLELVKHTNLQIWSDVKPLPDKLQQKYSIVQNAQKVITTAHRAGVPKFLTNKFSLIKRIQAASDSAAHFVDARIFRRSKAPIFGVEMFQKLRNSRVVLNNHIDISKNSASNMRLFEATGVGACLLTDWKRNLVELFESDTEILTYGSTEECVEKVKYILEHEDERRKIAAAGQQRTLRDHTFENRTIQIDEIIKKFLAS